MAEISGRSLELSISTSVGVRCLLGGGDKWADPGRLGRKPDVSGRNAKGTAPARRLGLADWAVSMISGDLKRWKD